MTTGALESQKPRCPGGPCLARPLSQLETASPRIINSNQVRHASSRHRSLTGGRTASATALAPMEVSPLVCTGWVCRGLLRLVLKDLHQSLWKHPRRCLASLPLAPVGCLLGWQPRTWLSAQTYPCSDDQVQTQDGVSCAHSALHKSPNSSGVKSHASNVSKPARFRVRTWQSLVT